jgi:hypothetical protein
MTSYLKTFKIAVLLGVILGYKRHLLIIVKAGTLLNLTHSLVVVTEQ